MAHPKCGRALGLWGLAALLASCGAHTAVPPTPVASAQSNASPTVAEAAKLPEDQQEQIIRGFVDRAVANLASPTGVDGKPKSAANLKQQRTLANLTRALFIKDPRPGGLPIYGPKVVLARIRKYSTQTPDRTVLDVMGELVDWSFQHFYTENEDLTGDVREKFDARSDGDQERWFRIFILNYENKRDNDRLIAALKAKDAEVLANMRKMYDNAVILEDGRHVLRTQDGDFMVVLANPDDGPDVKLDSAHYSEAQALYDCKQAAGIANGEEARAACSRKPAPATDSSAEQAPQRPHPTWDDPPDDPFGGDGGVIRPAQP